MELCMHIKFHFGVWITRKRERKKAELLVGQQACAFIVKNGEAYHTVFKHKWLITRF